MYIDTHTHLYDEQFDEDRKEMLERAMEKGVNKFLLPNCDLETYPKMMEMCKNYPENCFPMLGLHPCYVNEDFENHLSQLEKELTTNKFCAIGEIGLDYYWDKTFVEQQKIAFEQQIDWALSEELPIVIHTRDSIDDSIELVQKKQNGNLKGVFHCFGGNEDQAKKIVDLGFYLGIGGVVTFKNSNLKEIIKDLSLDNILLETDAPYLAPVPYRGKRNESTYIPLIADFLANIYEVSTEEISATTSNNALSLFNLK